MDDAQFVAALCDAPCDAAREALLAQVITEHAAELEPFAQTVKSAWFDRYLNADLRRAFAVADGIYQLGNMAHHPVVRALGLLARGDVERQSGHARTAMDLHTRAGNAFLAAGDRVGWARARGGWLAAASQAGRATEADLAAMEEVKAVLTSVGQTFRLAVMEQTIGVVYENLGQHRQALAAFDRALHLLPPDEQRLRAMILGNKANTLLWQGDLQGAKTLHRQACTLFHLVGNATSAAVETMLLAMLENARWHCRDALHLMSKAIVTLQHSTQTISLSNAYMYRSEILSTLNRFDDAVLDALHAVELLRMNQVPIDLAYALRLQARNLVRIGHEQEALVCLSEAETMMTQAGYVQRSWTIALERASMLALVGRPNEAREAALAILKAPLIRNAEPTRAAALLLAAEATFLDGKPHDAQAMAAAVITIGQRLQLPELLYRGYFLLAKIAGLHQHYDQANAAFDHAIIQLRQASQMLVLDQRSQFLEDKGDVFQAAIENALAGGDIHKAYLYFEQSREQQADGNRHTETVQDAHLAELRRRHRYVSNTLTALPHESVTAQAAERELGRLTNEIRDVIETHARTAAMPLARAGHITPTPLPTLAYACLNQDLVIFIRHDTHLLAHRVARGAETVKKAERALRLGIDTLSERLSTGDGQPAENITAQWGASIRMQLGRLWSVLIQPILHLLPPEGTALALIPQGFLHSIPWLALHDGERYLADRWLLHLISSTQIFGAPAPSHQHPLHHALALGYSLDDTLPQARAEAQHIAALLNGDAWIGAEALGERLLAVQGEMTHLHIAAHGAVRLDVPNASFVQLADGPFHPTDVVEMDLRGCRLVTLSACETGLGRMSGGDEQIGLVRAFGFAGAEAVLATLWRVDDASTFAFMDRFYRAIAASAPPAQALQSAQQQFIRGEAGPLRQHPYFWASFQLTTNVWRPDVGRQVAEVTTPHETSASA